MPTAREIMTTDVECAKSSDTLVDVAKTLKRLDVGALPICGDDNKLKGMVTDRDIVVSCLAEGGDPATATVESLGEHEVVTIGADDDVQDALATMTKHQVRRLPVIDGHELVGMITQADLAQAADPADLGETVEEISQ